MGRCSNRGMGAQGMGRCRNHGREVTYTAQNGKTEALRLRQRQLGSCCVVVPDPDMSGNMGLGYPRSEVHVLGGEVLCPADSESPSKNI